MSPPFLVIERVSRGPEWKQHGIWRSNLSYRSRHLSSFLIQHGCSAECLGRSSGRHSFPNNLIGSFLTTEPCSVSDLVYD